MLLLRAHCKGLTFRWKWDYPKEQECTEKGKLDVWDCAARFAISVEAGIFQKRGKEVVRSTESTVHQL